MGIDWFPLWLSLEVAALATTISLLLGIWLAWVLANKEFRGKDVLDAITTLPLALPPTVLGYYLLVVIGRASGSAASGKRSPALRSSLHGARQ